VTKFYGQHEVFRWAPHVMRCATSCAAAWP